nr:hypothetical protein [Candidatus Parabeggiatoa sp.]
MSFRRDASRLMRGDVLTRDPSRLMRGDVLTRETMSFRGDVLRREHRVSTF